MDFNVSSLQFYTIVSLLEYLLTQLFTIAGALWQSIRVSQSNPATQSNISDTEWRTLTTGDTLM